MKSPFLQSDFLKKFSIVCLGLAILASSCSMKMVITQSLNIENYSGQSNKLTTHCSFSALEKEVVNVFSEQKKSQDFSDFSIIKYNLSAFGHFDKTTSNFPLLRSVPLYILYQQLRASLLS
ncbi:hypothetical protein [Soonwooa purpurea]